MRIDLTDDEIETVTIALDLLKDGAEDGSLDVEEGDRPTKKDLEATIASCDAILSRLHPARADQ